MDLALLPALPHGLTWVHYGGMGVIVAIGACLQGVGGIGFAMFSAPMAGLFFPELVPGPLLVLGGALSLLTALRERDHIDWPAARSALGGRICGTLLAAWVITLLSAQYLAIAFACMILVAVAASLGGHGFAPSRRNIALAGAASGLMGTITSAGAPPFALVMHQLPPAQLRATLGGVFAIGTAISLAVLTIVGRFGWQQLWLGALLAPCMVAGFLASGGLARRISRQRVRALLLGLASLGALGILVQAAL